MNKIFQNKSLIDWLITHNYQLIDWLYKLYNVYANQRLQSYSQFLTNLLARYCDNVFNSSQRFAVQKGAIVNGFRGNCYIANP